MRTLKIAQECCTFTPLTFHACTVTAVDKLNGQIRSNVTPGSVAVQSDSFTQALVQQQQSGESPRTMSCKVISQT